MSGTLFKFTKPPDGLTRRAMFTNKPSWSELAGKIQSLYDISKDDVGVSYVDNDGDEVTLSSEEELQDYYKFNMPSKGFGLSGDAMKAIRFNVRDLSALRRGDEDKPLPQTPLSGGDRNTFGMSGLPTGVFDADEWQHIPASAFAPSSGSIFVPFVPEDSPSPHAFLEPVESDVSIAKDDDNQSLSYKSESDYGTPKVDKGKGKASVEEVDDNGDAVSSVCVVEEEDPDKQPVHVRQASLSNTEDIFGTRQPSFIQATTDERSATPTPSVPVVDVKEKNDEPIPDPPMPELEDIPPAPSSNVSLANDIASLLNTFSAVFARNPDLTEAVRRITRNAADGTYWSAHREAIARAAQEVRRSAEFGAESLRRTAEETHRAAEQEAGRRVADAIGSVLRAFGQVSGSGAGATGAPGGPAADPVTSTPMNNNSPHGPDNRRPHPPTWRDSWNVWTPRQGSPMGHPHHRRGDSFDSRRGSFMRPPRPMYDPPPHPPPFAHPIIPPPPPVNIPTIPSIPPMPPMPPMPPIPSLPPMPSFARPETTIPIPPPPPMMHIPGAFPESTHAQDPYLSSKESLQAAKERYKAEKEKYRREREARRARRMNTSGERYERLPSDGASSSDGASVNSSQPGNEDTTMKDEIRKHEYVHVVPTTPSPAPVAPADDPQLVSNARGTFPRIELFSVPRRHHTIHVSTTTGTPHMHHRPSPPRPSSSRPNRRPPLDRGMTNPFLDQPSSRAIQNVTRRLADMGFTAETYPSLPGKVNSRVLRVPGEVNREDEDAAVADVLEDILAQPSKPSPNASGSGPARSKSSTVPGAWN